MTEKPAGEWHAVPGYSAGQMERMPDGAVLAVKVAGRRLAVVKYAGLWKALDGRCPHSGGPLDTGHLDESGYLVCPWHRFAFDPDSGQCRGSGLYVNVYPVKMERGDAWVQLPRKRGWFF